MNILNPDTTEPMEPPPPVPSSPQQQPGMMPGYGGQGSVEQQQRHHRSMVLMEPFECEHCGLGGSYLQVLEHEQICTWNQPNLEQNNTPTANGEGDSGSTNSGSETAHECPVCLEEIDSDSAAMRCAGHGGQHHYFHANCLGQWIQSQINNGSQGTCPICRGPVEIHEQRLINFLRTTTTTSPSSSGGGGGGSQRISPAERTQISELLNNLEQIPDSLAKGWARLKEWEITEDVVEGIGIFAGLGVGFYAATSPGNGSVSGNYAVDRLVWTNTPQRARTAALVGYITGLGWQFIQRFCNREDEDNGGTNRRRRTH
jgi:hypothetical protein